MINFLRRLSKKNKFMGDIIYMCYLVANALIRICYLPFCLFPINRRKIVLTSFKGKRYADSPKYVLEELLRNYQDGYEIVWLANKKLKNVVSEIPSNVKIVPYGGPRMLYHLATSKFWIDSSTKIPGFLKRKKQLFIETWHGSYGLKKNTLDMDRSKNKIDALAMRTSFRKVDMLTSNGSFSTSLFRRCFEYEGEILEKGLPKNDIFIHKDRLEGAASKVRKSLLIKEGRVALYAPTYRHEYGISFYSFDALRFKKALETAFGGEWTVLIRLHPYLSSLSEELISYSDRIINASYYSDMQELLAVTDVLVSDYSSTMFDFLTSRRPCFIYATDIESYRQERDFYFNLDELPFPLSKSIDELVDSLYNFNLEEYEKEVDLFFGRVGLNESGMASHEVCEYIKRNT